MHSLILHPSLIFNHDLFPLSIFPHIPKEEGDREGRRAQFNVTSGRTPWRAFATCGRSVMSSVCKNHSMVQQSQTDISVRDRQTKMERPIVALPEEAGLEGASGRVSFPGFCRWKQGWRWSHPCANREIRAQKWIPSDSFLPGIRPADSFSWFQPQIISSLWKSSPILGHYADISKLG